VNAYLSVISGNTDLLFAVGAAKNPVSSAFAQTKPPLFPDFCDVKTKAQVSFVLPAAPGDVSGNDAGVKNDEQQQKQTADK